MSRSDLSRRLFVPLVLAALTLLFFYKIAFTGMILARGDVYAYFYPYWSVRNAALMNGQLPLWSPNIFMGVPLLANSQLGTFYPPNWPLVPFDPPTGITISLLVHVFWALLGAYVLARRGVGLDRIPALLAAVLLGLGGNVGAKAENINQLQALAWLPWLFVIFDQAIRRGDLTGRPYRLHSIVLFGVALALQVLAGHPQTVFITAVGLGIYGITVGAGHPTGTSFGRALPLRVRFINIVRPLLFLAFAGMVALLLAAPQLLPMLELMGGSNRSGGLNPQQAMAFSFNPFVIGRGLLPSYDGLLFGEYVAFVGVIGLGLAIVGIFAPVPVGEGLRPSPTRNRLPWLLLVIVGFGLALGLYNPLYWTLANLPGFSFFRVPARWLALFALAMAMLAGIGLQSLTTKPPRWWVIAVIVAVTAALGFASRFAEQMAVDVIGPALPTLRSVIGWTLALLVLLAALVGIRYIVSLRRYIVPFLCAAAVLELFLASRVFAYNAVVPPDVYSGQRFTISQLRAYGAEQMPPGRFLSISAIQFDPGDVDALTRRYRELGMSDLAIRIALVDTKMRETLSANLPLVWDVPGVDGFDGGVLPTGWYTQFTSLLLPPDELRTVDGRLREILAQENCRGACIPDQRWLNLTNTRYLITDKVYDLWHEDIAYDTQFTVMLQPGENTSIRHVPEFEANAVDVLYLCTGKARPEEVPVGCLAPTVNFSYSGGETETLTPADDETELGGFRLARFAAREAQTPTEVSLQAGEDVITVAAVTLVDTRVDVFEQLTLGPWRRVLSSDIKLYENLDVLPRAFVVTEVLTVEDDWQGSENALAMMRDPAFDPAQTAVIALNQSLPHPPLLSGDVRPRSSRPSPFDGEGEVDASEAPLYAVERGWGEVNILSYTPTHIEIAVNSETPGLLLLTDAYYPGWTAAVNGHAAPVYRADVMFRAVQIPAGESTVVFEFQPGWWPWPLVIGGAAWVAALALILIPRWRRKN